MDSGTILDLLFTTLMLAAKLAAPLLLSGLLVGLLISLFQAVTSINDSTLAFVPKLVVMAVVLWLSWPWLMQEMVVYINHVFYLLARVAR